MPGHHIIGAGHIAVATNRFGHEMAEIIQVGGQRQQRAGVKVTAAGHRQTHAKEQHAIAAVLHSFDQIFHGGQGDTGDLLNRGIYPPPFDQSAQSPQQFKVGARLHLQEDIGHAGAGCAANVDQNHGAIFTAVGHKHALRRYRITGEVTGMGFGRVAAPVDNEIGSILDFAQRRRALTHALEGNTRGPMTDRGGRVNVGPHQVSNGHRLALRFTGGIAQAIHYRETGIGQNLGGRFHGRGRVRLFTIDNGKGAVLDGMLGKPGFAQDAGILGLGNMVAFNGQNHVITNAATKGAGRVLDNVQGSLCCHSLFLSHGIG